MVRKVNITKSKAAIPQNGHLWIVERWPNSDLADSYGKKRISLNIS